MPEFMAEPETGRASDVVVRYGSLPTPGPMDGYYTSRVTEEGVYYYVKEVGGILVANGREIIIDPLPGGEDAGFRFLVGGVGLTLVLHQRGKLVLHASAVDMSGVAVAFVGWRGMGKSTTSATLHARGHTLITDDLLVLDQEEDGIQAVPGLPYFKLWPDTLQAILQEDAEGHPRVHPAAVKRIRTAKQDAQHDALPLGVVYILDEFGDAEDGDQLVHIEPVCPRQACIELTQHSSALIILQQEGISPRHLEQCADLARRIPVRRLRKRANLARLADLARHIERDVARTVSAVGAPGRLA